MENLTHWKWERVVLSIISNLNLGGEFLFFGKFKITFLATYLQ